MSSRRHLGIVWLALHAVVFCTGFVPKASLSSRASFATSPSWRHPNVVCHETPDESSAVVTEEAEEAEEAEAPAGKRRFNPLLKASWLATEAFGKVASVGRRLRRKDAVTEEPEVAEQEPEAETFTLDEAPKSLSETLARLKEDNENEYFLSGKMDLLIYDEQCEFADPFVSFNGRDRFVENLENLSNFITEYSAKPLSYEEVDETTVQTKFMVKLELNLPWKPVLAWPWGVTCTVDPESNLIVSHKESWDIDPWEGVGQVFRAPTTSVS